MDNNLGFDVFDDESMASSDTDEEAEGSSSLSEDQLPRCARLPVRDC